MSIPFIDLKSQYRALQRQSQARARGRVEAHELLQAGVTQFSRETFSSALELGRKTLMTLGMLANQLCQETATNGYL